MGKYFFLDDTPMYKNKYIIRIDPTEMPFKTGMRGSFDVLIARILNLPYNDYLRYCRDRLGAELVGKNSRYITVYLDDTDVTRMFVKLLNKRMDYLLNEQKYPYDYKQEQDEIVRISWKGNEN